MRAARERAPLHFPFLQADPESVVGLQRELFLIEHDGVDGFFCAFQDKLLQEASYQQLRFHESESIADAFPGPQSERQINVRIDLVLVLLVEPFGIELLRVRIVIGIVMQTVNGQHQHHIGLDDQGLVARSRWRQFVLFAAKSISHDYRRILPEGLGDHHVHINHLRHRFVRDVAVSLGEVTINLLAQAFLDVRIDRELVNDEAHQRRARLESREEEDEGLRNDVVQRHLVRAVLVPRLHQ